MAQRSHAKVSIQLCSRAKKSWCSSMGMQPSTANVMKAMPRGCVHPSKHCFAPLARKYATADVCCTCAAIDTRKLRQTGGVLGGSKSARSMTTAVGVERGGFVNTGSTCYLNSFLQALFHDRVAVDRLAAHRPGPDCQPHCMHCVLAQVERESRLPGGTCRTECWAPVLAEWGLAYDSQQDILE
eukprot:1734635-Prorocentrum_lima.AAC.1